VGKLNPPPWTYHLCDQGTEVNVNSIFLSNSMMSLFEDLNYPSWERGSFTWLTTWNKDESEIHSSPYNDNIWGWLDHHIIFKIHKSTNLFRFSSFSIEGWKSHSYLSNMIWVEVEVFHVVVLRKKLLSFNANTQKSQ
jgi:hypothetical protein